MSDLNVNVNSNYDVKKSEQVDSAAKTQNSQTTSDAIPMVAKKEVWEELGITREQYIAVTTKHPNFQSLSKEEQIKILSSEVNSNKNNVDTTSQANNTQPANASSAEDQQAQAVSKAQDSSAVETAKSASVSKNEEVDDTKASTTETTAETDEISQQDGVKLTDAEMKARKNFDGKNLNNKINILVEDYAKNEYLYGGDQQKTEEEWNALSDKEKEALIKNSKNHIDELIKNMGLKDIEDINSLKQYVTNNVKGGRELTKNVLDKLYTSIQVSNANAMPASFYSQLTSDEKTYLTYNYIENIKNAHGAKEADNILNDYEKQFYNENKTLLDAFIFYAKDVKGEDYSNICLEDIQGCLESFNSDGNGKTVNKVDVLKHYYEAKVEEYQAIKEDPARYSVLSDSEKESYEEMGKQLELMNKLYDTKYGRLYQEKKLEKPDPPSILDEINAKENNTLQADDKLVMVEASLSKKGKVAAKELGACIQSAMADGDFILANKLYELAMNKYPNHFKTLVGNEDVRALAAANIDKMNNEQLATVNESASGIANKEERVAYKRTMQDQVSSGEQSKQVAQLHIEDKDQEVRIGVVENLRNKAKTPETQDEIDVIIREKGDIPTRAKAIATTKELDKSIQLKSLERQVNDNIPDLLTVAVGVPSTLEESAKAGEIVFNATAKLEDASVRISLQNKLADDVVNYKKPEDQLAMHDILMTAKDQEVLEHAASNIYKYDESVQAGALDSTKATGNEGAIDAAMANYDKYAPSIQEDPKYQAMMHETEVRQSQEIAQQVADFHVEYEKITGMKSNIEKEITDKDQKLNYIRNFLNASPQEQFKMLSKIPMSWQGTVFSKIATFCPQMLSGLVKQGYGKHILNTPGLSSDVIYKVVNIMLMGQSSDKKVAVKYVKSHQSMFSSSTIERCEEILSSDNIKTKKYSSMPLFSSVKGALAPKMSDNYPNKVNLDVYNA